MSAPDPASILEQRARKLAEPIHQEVAREETLELLHFVVATGRYALETSFVRRIARLGHVTPLPTAPEQFAGVINLAGEILPLIDLDPLVGTACAELQAWGRAVVLGRGRSELALAVREATVVERVPLTAVDESTARRSAAPFVRGTAGTTVVLNGDALLDDPRLVIKGATQ